MEIFFGGGLIPVEAWIYMHGSIVGAGAKADCWSLLDLNWVDLICKAVEEQLSLMVISIRMAP